MLHNDTVLPSKRAENVSIDKTQYVSNHSLEEHVVDTITTKGHIDKFNWNDDLKHYKIDTHVNTPSENDTVEVNYDEAEV